MTTGGLVADAGERSHSAQRDSRVRVRTRTSRGRNRSLTRAALVTNTSQSGCKFFVLMGDLEPSKVQTSSGQGMVKVRFPHRFV